MSGSVHPCRCLMALTSFVQAHVAPIRSLEDVERVMATLLTNGKIARATHNIMAYRIAVTDKDTVLQVCSCSNLHLLTRLHQYCFADEHACCRESIEFMHIGKYFAMQAGNGDLYPSHF